VASFCECRRSASSLLERSLSVINREIPDLRLRLVRSMGAILSQKILVGLPPTLRTWTHLQAESGVVRRCLLCRIRTGISLLGIRLP
jgi:hypothetical protein